MKIIKNTLAVFFISFLSLFLTLPTFAQSYNFNSQSGLDSAGQVAGYNVNPEKNIEFYIGQIISIILSLLGVIFLILIIYGGVSWMTAGGNEEKVGKAKELITEALIGLIIVLAAYAITYFVLKQLVGISLINNLPN